MKHRLAFIVIALSLLLAFSLPASAIYINVTNFPDDNFRNYLLEQDYGKNGVLTEAEIKGITSINVDEKEIRSLKGIEFFTALTSLSCGYNWLTALDVSKNTALISLSCGFNQLKALDVSKNTALTYLDCSRNQLSALDVSKNTALASLTCHSNELTALDVSKNTALTDLNCSGTELTALDVSKNTALTSLLCGYNELTALDVSKNTALTTLYCYGNQLTTLDVSKNTALTELGCYGNNLKGEAMTALINSLLNNNSSVEHYFRAIFDPTAETNILSKSQVAAVKAKGWIPQYIDFSYGWKEYEGSNDEGGEEPTVGIDINTTNFPDENFRNYLLEKDYGKDGVLTEEEIKGITFISVDSKGISSLKGIEYFTALEMLSCTGNQLTALDVSKNSALDYLSCYDNLLSALDVSKNTALKSLYCQRNQLTALDVSKNAALKILSCFNNQLTALDVSKNTALTSLLCSYNQLIALDVSKNTALNSLSCYNNQLTALDMSKNTALTDLNCSDNQLTALDVSKNTALTELYCYNNQLTALDVSKNTTLTTLYCYRNSIKEEAMTELINSLTNNSSIDHYFRAIYKPTYETNILTKSQVAAVKAKGWIPQYYDYGWKEYVSSDDEGGEEPTPVEININATNFPDENFRNYLLEQEYGKDGALTEEEIEDITEIDVDEKEISSLKGIEYFTALTKLDCSSNKLTALDVSKNTTLTWLSCYSNQLTALDVSKNTVLNYLICFFNQLTALDVSKNTALTYLYCPYNQLTALDVSKNTALTYLNCSGNQLTALDVKNTALTELQCDYNQLTALDVSKNTALTWFNCDNNQLTALDVSKNTALTYLDCSNNQLTALDVSKNTALTELWCSNIQLTALDVSKNTALTRLSCDENQLTALDVSKNTALTTLLCSNNQLTILDVSKNTALSSLDCYRNNIKGAAMTSLINSLPNNNSSESHYFRAIDNPTDETNILTKSQVAAVKAKGWIPQYNDYGWKEYEGSDDEGGEEPAIEKCEKPTILYANGELTFGCATEGVEFHWTITNGTDSSGKGSKVSFTPKTTVSVYASKDGYKDSDTATLDINGSGGLKGDVNNNGGIDIGDAVTIVNFLVGKTATLSRKLETGTDGGEPLREKEPQ